MKDLLFTAAVSYLVVAFATLFRSLIAFRRISHQSELAVATLRRAIGGPTKDFQQQAQICDDWIEKMRNLDPVQSLNPLAWFRIWTDNTGKVAHNV